MRNRVKELRMVSASELHRNPKNWRRHPEPQKRALAALLNEIGFAGAELARELPDGSLELIDGHCRADLAGDEKVPVLILDVDEAEADKILATFDPIGAMAETDGVALAELLRTVQTQDQDLADMLTALLEEAGGMEAEPGGQESSSGEVDSDFEMGCKCPKCGFEFDND